jgi:hypothetical protein
MFQLLLEDGEKVCLARVSLTLGGQPAGHARREPYTKHVEQGELSINICSFSNRTSSASDAHTAW